MQGGPSYSPPASYPAPSSHHQQQPLFIIIPSAGKPSYKARPHVYSAPPTSYDYNHANYGLGAHRAAAARRLSPYLRRRSASLLSRRRQSSISKPLETQEVQLESVIENPHELEQRHRLVASVGHLDTKSGRSQRQIGSKLSVRTPRLMTQSGPLAIDHEGQLAKWPIFDANEEKKIEIGQRQARVEMRQIDLQREHSSGEATSRPLDRELSLQLQPPPQLASQAPILVDELASDLLDPLVLSSSANTSNSVTRQLKQTPLKWIND